MAIKVQTLTQTGVGSTASVVLQQTDVFGVGIGVDITGTVTYTVEYSYDGTLFYPVANLSALAADASAKFDTPCKFLRLRVSAGTGTAIMSIVQQGERV